MINLSLTEEQEAAALMVREFVEREVTPTIQEYDRKQEMNPASLPRMGELGILGINIPVSYGGQGFDWHLFSVDSVGELCSTVGLRVLDIHPVFLEGAMPEPSVREMAASDIVRAHFDGDAPESWRAKCWELFAVCEKRKTKV